MRDLSNQSQGDAGEQQSLERTDSMSLFPLEQSDYRSELYARLRAIIDNATESIRTLKEENGALAARNTEMANQVSTLEQRIRAVMEGLANDELALRRSAEALEQVMRGTATAGSTAGASPASNNAASKAMMHDTQEMQAPSAPAEMSEPVEEAETAAATVASLEDTGPDEEPEPPTTIAPDEHDDHERVVAPSAETRTDGTYTLIAYPFVRFSDLGQFQAALQKLTGVHDAQVRRFAQGTLEMRLGYSGTTDLVTMLRTLANEIEDVSEEEPNQLRVRLRTNQDA